MPLRVAIVHDWLVTLGGAERVLEQLLRLYPQADLFSLVDFLPAAERGWLGDRAVHTSALQRLPFARRRYRGYLPLMPLLVEQFEVRDYDLVISSSYAVAKGVLAGPDALHVCYCHSPIRYAWDLQGQYLRETGRASGFGGWAARALLHYIRLWDARTAAGVDRFVANSRFVARRIRRTYRREATVVHPPVDTTTFTVAPAAERRQFLTVSRLVPYKRVDLIVEAFRGLPHLELVVIGDGPQADSIARDVPPNVRLLGHQPVPEVVRHLQRARAFVFAAEEDFGIAPLEAQACGTPVVAFGRGGALETVVAPGTVGAPTGVFFDAQTVEAVRSAVDRFVATEGDFAPGACRAQAERFAPERFREAFAAVVDEEWARLGTPDRPGRADVSGRRDPRGRPESSGG